MGFRFSEASKRSVLVPDAPPLLNFCRRIEFFRDGCHTPYSGGNSLEVLRPFSASGPIQRPPDPSRHRVSRPSRGVSGSDLADIFQPAALLGFTLRRFVPGRRRESAFAPLRPSCHFRKTRFRQFARTVASRVASRISPFRASSSWTRGVWPRPPYEPALGLTALGACVPWRCSLLQGRSSFRLRMLLGPSRHPRRLPSSSTKALLELLRAQAPLSRFLRLCRPVRSPCGMLSL